MKPARSLTILLFALGFWGCGDLDSTQGNATYSRAKGSGGQPVPPQENAEDFQLAISLEGDGAWSLLEGVACTLTSGSVEGSVQSSGEIKSDGSYASFFATASGEFSSPLDILCNELQEVEFNAVTAVTITASIPANQNNCDTFCQSEAQVDCEADPDQATCIAAAEAACQTDCSNSERITGSGSISAEALGDLNGKLGSGKIQANVDLIFDSLE